MPDKAPYVDHLHDVIALAVAHNDGYAEPLEVRGHFQQATVILEAVRAAATCPTCGHEWRRHDPDDGRCGAHSSESGVFGPCRCGRDVQFTATANARHSREALDAR